VRDLDLPVEIVACPTVREPDGLAMSSRNQYLSEGQRRQATSLQASMKRAAESVARGAIATSELIEDIQREIHAAGPATIEYVAIVDPETLSPVDRVEGPVRICLAVRIGPCRSIDNLAVDGGGRDR
ncbi:MAG: pantoate--beta-alanine ligase, partial [Planctomycetota bacterium]